MNPGRRYSVEVHPHKMEIERDIIAGKSDKDIADTYSHLSSMAIKRYRDTRMPQILRHAQLETVEGLIGRINEYMDTVEDLKDSIITVLDNPENPGHICYYPRAEEIRVKYYDKESQRYKVDKLQNLLQCARERNSSITITGAHVEGSDPRLTLLKTADVLNKQLELLCKTKGYIVEDNSVTINAGASGNVGDIADIARTALAPYPEAMEAFVNALLSAAAEGDKELKAELEKEKEGESKTC